MELIAALDLKDSQIVHGVKGERKNYVPPKSYLFKTAGYKDVISNILSELGISKFYVADLNSITSNSNNFALISSMKESFPNIEIYLDSGAYNMEQVEKCFELGIDKVIIGSETLHSLDELVGMIDKYAEENILFSVDSIDGKIISKCEQLNGRTVIDIVPILDGIGVRRIILLELRRVGSELGYDTKFMEQVKTLTKKFIVYIGGGVRDVSDLQELSKYDVSGSILATAIYTGAVNKYNLTKLMNYGA